MVIGKSLNNARKNGGINTKIECIESLVICNREIEFEYNNKRYSITYYYDNQDKYISFCEFYKEPIDVRNTRELLCLKIGDATLAKIFERFT